MAATQASARIAPCAARTISTQKSALGSLPGLVQQRNSLSTLRPVEGRQVSRTIRSPVQTQVATEVYEVADVAGFIGGTAATMFAMTLVGLAIGFVLLRVEALAEEGKI